MWFLYLFLAGHLIAVPGHFISKEQCISHGEQALADYRRYHSNSSGWFWCVQGGNL